MQATPVRPIQLPSRERIFVVLSGIIVTLFAAGIIVETIRFVVFSGAGVPRGGTLMSLFDMDNEDSVSTWFQGLHLAFAGMLSLAWVQHDPREVNWGWRALGVVFFLLSLDELISLHERFGEPMRRALSIDGGPLFFAWVVLGLIAALAFAIMMFPFLRRISRETALRLVVAGAVFVAGAAGMEMVGGAIAGSTGQANYPYRMVMITEETLEMIGTFLAIRALLLHFPHPNPGATRQQRRMPAS